MGKTPSTYRVKATAEVGQAIRFHTNGPTQGYVVANERRQITVVWLLFDGGAVRAYESSAIEPEDWIETHSALLV